MDLRKYQSRRVVLVNERDQEVGETSLIEAHKDGGKKHRAFSLVLFRRREDDWEILMQQRAAEKPVFAHYWANTCCYNMAPGEEYGERVRSRVKEELGIELGETKLNKLYRFSYEAADPERPGWGENEWDQVIVGEWSGAVKINPEEVEDYRWVGWKEIRQRVEEDDPTYAPWWKLMVAEGKLKEMFESEWLEGE